MVDPGKRAADGSGDQPEAKKARAGDGSAAAAPAAPKPGLNLEALQKAKALLEKQKQLKEKLKKLPQVAGAAAAGAAAAGAAPSAAALAASANPLAPGVDVLAAAKAARAAEIAAKFGVSSSLTGMLPTAAGAAAVRPALGPRPVGVRPTLVPPASVAGAGPRPLLLDAQGREVDEHGHVIEAPRAPITASLINQRRASPEASPEPPGPRDEDFIDHSMPARHAAAMEGRGGWGRGRGRGAALGGRGRRRGALEFVEEGSFARAAEIMRLKQKYGEDEFRRHLPPHLRRPPRGPVGPAEREPAPEGAPLPEGVPEGVSGANLVPLGVRQVEVSPEEALRASLPELSRPPPDVEWWDKPLLEGGAYFTQPLADEQQQGQQLQEQGQGQGQGQPEGSEPQPMDEDQQEQQPEQSEQAGASGSSVKAARAVLATAPDGSGRVMRLRAGKVTRYVEHPVPLEPPDTGPPPAPQPLKLTKRELKKLRTQRRQAREKEKQELMRQGLLEPPKPKVKISNLMRVLGEQATLDPTAIEQEVRRQMSERQAAHDDRNVARALTPAERRDKKLRKLFDASSGGGASSLAAVYRVERLDSRLNRLKVDLNAKENHMSGIMLTVPASFSLVVVEGCPKALKRYHKLMLRRIDWDAAPRPAGAAGGDEPDEPDEAAEAAEAAPNSCHLVWEGVVGSAAFRSFMKEEVATPEAARALLDARGVAHYYDAAATFDFDAAPLPSAVFEH